MKIDIWSDFVCPFCYIGDQNLTLALAAKDYAEDVEIVYHSYQLDPEIDYVEGRDYKEYMMQNKGMSDQQYEKMTGDIGGLAEQAGLHFDFDQIIPVNTFGPHRVFQYAKEQGLGSKFYRRLYAAHFEEGENLNKLDTIVRLASDIGLNADKVREIAQSAEDYHEDVVEDIQASQKVGVQGVPFFVLNDKYAVSGAQPVEVFENILDQVQAETDE